MREIISQYGEIKVKGSSYEDIIRKWEGLAYGAESEGDIPTCHIYRQQAEHYKRELDRSGGYETKEPHANRPKFQGNRRGHWKDKEQRNRKGE